MHHLCLTNPTEHNLEDSHSLASQARPNPCQTECMRQTLRKASHRRRRRHVEAIPKTYRSQSKPTSERESKTPSILKIISPSGFPLTRRILISLREMCGNISYISTIFAKFINRRGPLEMQICSAPVLLELQ